MATATASQDWPPEVVAAKRADYVKADAARAKAKAEAAKRTATSKPSSSGGKNLAMMRQLAEAAQSTDEDVILM
jgi:hypothetical protein